jgi:nucleolar protein 4
MAKRTAAHKSRTEKLENPNYSVSTTRLCVRNLPRTVDEPDLRTLVAGVAGGAKLIKQIKIVRDTERTVGGAPRSRGYGFAELRTHEAALAVLRRLNNNPGVWGAERRPIVEFALDDARKMQHHTKVQAWGSLSQQRAEAKAAKKNPAAAVAAAADHALDDELMSGPRAAGKRKRPAAETPAASAALAAAAAVGSRAGGGRGRAPHGAKRVQVGAAQH